MNDSILKGMIKASMIKEALASCQVEGIGNDVTIEDLYLAELKEKKCSKVEQELI